MSYAKPMLAKEYDETRLTFPSYVQPKLDGIRLLAGKINGKLVFHTRTGKDATSSVQPGIRDKLNAIIEEGQWYDGEMYARDARGFSNIVHRFRKDPSGLQYHVFDMVDRQDMCFEDRFNKLRTVFKGNKANGRVPLVSLVPCFLVRDAKEFNYRHSSFVRQGYEGTMIRNKDARYTSGRTWDLMKYKDFKTDEFKIVDAIQGKGAHHGAIIWVLETSDKNRFKAVMAAPLEERRQLFEERNKHVGKMLTVKFQEYTNKTIVPRFPIGLAIRDYE